MGLADIFKKAKNAVQAEAPKDGSSRYRKECQYLWDHYIPNAGQSDILQGELLRQVEALRYEAFDNGNINWDDDFSFFCDFVKDTLCSYSALPQEQKEAVRNAMDHIKACGEYSVQFYADEISDKDLNVDMIACLEEDLYDAVEEAIGFMYAQEGPIPYQKNPNILR